MKQKYKILRNVIGPDAVDLIKTMMLMSKDVAYHQKNIPKSNTTALGDEQSPNSYAYYGSIFNDSLAESLLPLMEQETGLELYPTYTYSRIYWPGAILKPHKDRPSCQYSATLCIDNDPKPWPIYMESKKVILQPGDMVIYRGCDVEHWRDPYDGNQQIQVFLHYVDANGKYADHKFDKRPMLGLISERKK
jgi:hypothetical protein